MRGESPGAQTAQEPKGPLQASQNPKGLPLLSQNPKGLPLLSQSSIKVQKKKPSEPSRFPKLNAPSAENWFPDFFSPR